MVARKALVMNTLSVTEKETILGLLRLGWSIRHVSRETGRRHETIARYGREAGLLPAKPHTADKVPTDLSGAIAQAKARSRSVCEPHRGFIEAEAAKGCNAKVIYQGLVEHHGYEDAYDAVKRFVRKLHPVDPKISCRFETPAAEEAQVDYGEGAPTRDPRTGKYRKPRLFVMTLGSKRLLKTVLRRGSPFTMMEGTYLPS